MNIDVTMRALVRLTEDEPFNPDIVSPGVVGFILTGALAVAVILLGVNLVRRLRRNAYRHEVREEIEAELSAEDRTGGDESGRDPEPPRTDLER